MSEHGRQEDGARRKDKNKPTRIKSATATWGRETARRAKMSYDKSEFDDWVEGDASGQAEADSDRREADADRREAGEAYEAFRLETARECAAAVIRHERVRKTAPPKEALTERERERLDALNSDIAEALDHQDAAVANDRINDLEDAIGEAHAAATLRLRLRGAVEQQSDRFDAIGWLTDEERAMFNERVRQALAIIAVHGGSDPAAEAEPGKLGELVDKIQAAVDARSVVVGQSDVGAVKIATNYFDATFDAALAVLKGFETQKRKFRDLPALIAEVGKDPDVIEAKQKAAEEQIQRNTILCTISAQGQKINITEYDVKRGRWEMVTTARGDGGQRDNDYGLTMTIDGVLISCHLHPPKFSGGQPTSGGFKYPGSDPGLNQTPSGMIAPILKHHGRPAAWDT